MMAQLYLKPMIRKFQGGFSDGPGDPEGTPGGIDSVRATSPATELSASPRGLARNEVIRP